MIKSIPLNNISVVPFWTDNKEDKPVTDTHGLISSNPYLNIIACGRKGSGKTTVCLHLIINHFMTKLTKLVIFSPDILNDKKNVGALKFIQSTYDKKKKRNLKDTALSRALDNTPKEDTKFKNSPHVVVYDRFINTEDRSNNLLDEIDEAKEAFLEDNETPHSFPNSIFYFDDLSNNDFKSEEIGHFAQNLRHYGALCLYSSQDWKNFEPRIRKNTDIVLLWKSVSRDRLKDIYDEIQPGGTFKDFEKIYNYATKGTRDFLFIDVPNKIFRKNLDEEIYIKPI